MSVLVAEPNSYRWTQDSLKDGRVELFQQLLWQVMNIVMFEADFIIVSWLGRFLKECLIHKFIRTYVNAVEIQMEDRRQRAV